MMMNNKIDGIQRQYMFAVEPVKFFEAQKNPQAQKSSFDFNFISQMNSKGFNPFHPIYFTDILHPFAGCLFFVFFLKFLKYNVNS